MRTRCLVLVLLLSLLAIGGVTILSIKQNVQAKSVGAEFRDIALALQSHIASQGNLPSAVNWNNLDPPMPLYSWRLNVSSFLEGFGYPGTDYQSSWNSVSNSRLHKMPTSLALSFRLNDNPQNLAKVYAVTGPDTAFGAGTNEATSWSPEKIPPDTIIAIEVANSELHWMEPGDFQIETFRDDILAKNGEFLTGHVPGRFHVIFADFEVWALSTETPFENFEHFLTKSGASKNDRNDLLKPHRLASYNGGG